MWKDDRIFKEWDDKYFFQKLLTRFAEGTVKSRAELVVGAFLVYALAYLPLRAWVGMAAGLLAVVPIALAGWAFGLRGGVLGGLLITLLHTILMNLASPTGWDVMLRETNGIGPLAAIVVGFTTGYWSDLSQALHLQIAQRKHAEAALCESEKRLQLFIDYAPAALAMFDREMRYLAVSRRWMADYKLGDQNILGQSHYDIFPEIPEYWKAAHRRGLAGETVTTDQDEFTRMDGSIQWLRWVVLPWSDVSGSIGGIIIFSEDITERRAAEKALRDADQKYYALFEQRHDAVFILDLQGRHLNANQRAVDMLGYTLNELIGISFRDISAEVPQSEQILDRLQRGEIIPLYERVFRKKSGELVPVEISAELVRDIKGNPLHIQSVSRDITERKQTELALQESEQRFSVLSAATFEGIAISEKGSVIDANEQLADMLEYERSEMIGLSVELFVAPESLALVRQHIRSGSEEPYEHLALRKDGSAFPVEIRAKSLPYDGRIVRVTAIRDITERKRAEDEIRRKASEAAALLETSLALSSLDLEITLQIVSQHAMTLFAADGCRIFLMEPDEQTLHCVVALQENATVFSQLKVKVGEGVTGAVAANGRAEIVNDMLHDPRSVHVFGTPQEQEAIMFAPLSAQGRTIGVLSIRRVGSLHLFQAGDLELLKAFASMAASAVSNARLLEETQRSLERLSTLRQIDQVITGVLDLRVTLDIILGYVLNQLKVDAAAVLVYHPALQSLEFAAGRGFRTEMLHSTRFHLGEGFASRAVVEQRMIRASDLSQIHAGFFRLPEFRAEKFTTYIGVPLFVKGNIAGVLEIYHRQALDPDQEWMVFLETLAGQTAIAIDNTRLFEDLQSSNMQLRQAYDATIEGWAQALELRDMETEGHSHRTVDLTMELFQRMEIEESQVEHVRRGALLHDIGKMGIPDAILQKKGPLNDAEWAIMRMHPVYAYQWLAPISYLQPALDIPYCHHEHWDGTGYPRGLIGEQIPLAARIFAVVDAWDALRSNRSYRSSWTREQARAHIVEQSGKHFDPKVVEAFLQLIDNE